MNRPARFSGKPKTEWLDDGRNMLLLEEFTFTDDEGSVWVAPKGSPINGASIPKFLWSTVGSPYAGLYRNASIIHDVYCVSAGVDRDKRKAADRMFHQGCLAGGCSKEEAAMLYAGVRAGASSIDAGMVEGDMGEFHFNLEEDPPWFKRFRTDLGNLAGDYGLDQLERLIKPG